MKPRVHCSSLGRIEACPGSLRAADGIESTDTVISISGTVIHDVLKVWAQGREVNGDILGEREGLIYRWFHIKVEELEDAHGGIMVRLPEIKMEWEQDGFILVGRGDLIVIPADGTIHLIDYKTGFASQIPAPSNRQLMGYVVQVNNFRPQWKEVNAHLFSAGDPAESRFTLAVYGPEEISAAKRYLNSIINGGLADDAPRTPGDHCQYCPALGTNRCPETADKALEAGSSSITIRPSDVLPVPQKCAEIYDAIKAVERFFKAFLPALKEAVEKSPESWQGTFTLKAGAKKRSFRDTEAACSRLIDNGITPEQIWKVISLTPAKSEGLIKVAKKGQMKAKDVKEYFNQTFADLIEEGQSASSLIRAAG